MIDYEALREELRDECFAAYYGGGIGPALMDALSVDDMSPEELMKTARLWGIPESVMFLDTKSSNKPMLQAFCHNKGLSRESPVG